MWHVHSAVCILYFNNKKKMEEKREEAAKTRKCVRSREVLSMAGIWHSKGRVSRMNQRDGEKLHCERPCVIGEGV